MDKPLGAYPTHHYVACKKCGNFSRMQFMHPLMQASTLTLPKFCPFCGAPYEYDMRFPNAPSFILVAASLGLDPAVADELEEIHSMWSAYEYTHFKEFLQSLKGDAA